MTIDELNKHCDIPIKILQKYKKWELNGNYNKFEYDDKDIEHLSIIMTLYDVGFDDDEVEIYMRLFQQGKATETQRLALLNQKRSDSLNEIHFKEKQLSQLDYLQHKIQNI